MNEDVGSALASQDAQAGEPSLVEAWKNKPAYLEKCNGCGVCCLAMPCGISMGAFGTQPGQRCPVLEWREGRFWCGAYEMDTTGFVRLRLGIGEGCDSPDPVHRLIAKQMKEASEVSSDG